MAGSQYVKADLKVADIGSSVWVNGTKIEEDVSFSVGPLAYATADIYVVGTQTVPIIGVFDNTTFTINWKHYTKEIMTAFNPELNEYELRWNDLVVDRNNGLRQKKVTHKMVISGWPMSILPEITINPGESISDIAAEHGLISMYYYIDGEEVIAFHRTEKTYRVNGKDIFENLRDGL